MRRLLLAMVVMVPAGIAWAAFSDTYPPALDNPAIHYDRDATDPVAKLDARLKDGSVKLAYDDRGGYLKALLDALQIPVESQVFVQSKTSFQARLISPENPRSIFFNDRVAVGWMNKGFIEIASQDPVQGIIFYLLEQDPKRAPRFHRDDSCVSCHRNDATLGAPGVFARSFPILPDGEPLLIYGAGFTDHRTPLEQRWGGWYVTGAPAGVRHMGNAVLVDRDKPNTVNSTSVASLADKFPVDKYLSPYSDAAALLVFDHQMQMMNYITRLGWDARAGEKYEENVKEFVDYLLFVNEAKLTQPMGGEAGFAKTFSAQGPRDSKGRSLRQLNLKTRLLEYPCSYLIYSEAFDALPTAAKASVYKRMYQVLTTSPTPTKQAVMEILRETKPEVQQYFR